MACRIVPMCATGATHCDAEAPSKKGNHTATKKPRSCAPWIVETPRGAGSEDTKRNRGTAWFQATNHHISGPAPSAKCRRKHLRRPSVANFFFPPAPTRRVALHAPRATRHTTRAGHVRRHAPAARLPRMRPSFARLGVCVRYEPEGKRLFQADSGSDFRQGARRAE